MDRAASVANRNDGKERFFRTLDEESLLIRNPRCSELRIRDVEQFLWYYNQQRPHLGLRGLTTCNAVRLTSRRSRCDFCLGTITGHYKDKPGSAIMNGSNAIPERPA